MSGHCSICGQTGGCDCRSRTPSQPAMVSEEMIEAVAKAIWREDYVLDPKGDLAEMGGITAPQDEAELADWPVDKERCERQGRAAIAAMLAASPIEDGLVDCGSLQADFDHAEQRTNWPLARQSFVTALRLLNQTIDCEVALAAEVEAQSHTIRVMREALEAVKAKAAGAGYDPMQALSEIESIARSALGASSE